MSDPHSRKRPAPLCSEFYSSRPPRSKTAATAMAKCFVQWMNYLQQLSHVALPTLTIVKHEQQVVRIDGPLALQVVAGTLDRYDALTARQLWERAVSRLETAGPRISVGEYQECLTTIVLILMRSAGPRFGAVQLLFRGQTLYEVKVITSVIIAKDPDQNQLADALYDLADLGDEPGGVSLPV